MDKALEVGEGEGGVRRWVAPKVAPNMRQHHTLWISVLYATTIVVVLGVVAILY